MFCFFVDNFVSVIDWLDFMDIKLNNLIIIGGMSEKCMYCFEDGLVVGKYLVDGLLKNV